MTPEMEAGSINHVYAFVNDGVLGHIGLAHLLPCPNRRLHAYSEGRVMSERVHVGLVRLAALEYISCFSQ